MNGRAQLWQSGKSFLQKMFLGLGLVVLLQPRPATAQLSASEALGFFTNLSSRLLQSESGLSLNQIQVYPTNQYTPAVHRLLQVAANLWETTSDSTNGLPTVFQARFGVTNGAVYLSTYVEVTNHSQLAGLPLLDLTASANASSLIPPDGNALVFGVPLVIGARKGLPNFNEFAMESTFVLTRKVELRKSGPGGWNTINQTNQFFTLSLTMPSAVEFWNSYGTNYTRPVDIYITNRTTMRLTNDLGVDIMNTFVIGERISTNDWTRFQDQSSITAKSFITGIRSNVPFLPLVGYVPLLGFVSATNTALFDTSQALLAPRWGMTITNRVQAMILEQGTGRIIDYVLLGNLVSYRDLTGEFSNPTTGTGDPFETLWATNVLASGRLSGRVGILQQINVSRGANGGIDLSDGRWHDYGTFNPNNVQIAVDRFNQFFQANSTNLIAMVPFSPTVQTSVPMIWQANDPLVHCLSSELFSVAESGQIRKNVPPTMAITNSLPNIGKKNKRYRPWPVDPGATWDDPDAFNATIKDPLVRSSEDWDFPTNACLAIETLGRIHRGTPWQTLYLKSSELGLSNVVASPGEWAGNAGYPYAAITWASWTGNPSLPDGFHTRPVRDWSLVALIATLINTNDPRQLLSVNDQNSDNWRTIFDGMLVLTNTRPNNLVAPAQFETLTMTSNSPQAMLLAEAIALARSNQPGQVFRSLGGLLATPELTTVSPWLNYSGTYQLQRGITDEAYEKIPSQLLSRVRADSVGSVLHNGTAWHIQFTGFDNYPYAVESSTNMVNWTSVSTNYPTNGVFTFTDSPAGIGSSRFYRSVLLP